VENRERPLKCQPSRDDNYKVQCREVRVVGVTDKRRRWKGSLLVKSLSCRKNSESRIIFRNVPLSLSLSPSVSIFTQREFYI